MKRINGWGDHNVTASVPPKAETALAREVGEPRSTGDRDPERILADIPESRTSDVPGVSCDPLERFVHSHGQSLPDWVRMRAGTLATVVDGVVFPESSADVQEILRLAMRKDLVLIPFGGGTSVVGHLTVPESERPVLSVSLSKMAGMLSLDERDRLARFQAGALGPDIEGSLRARGFTLGHYPQSFEHSSLGGWVATRSSGQQSRHFGRIEQLFQGGELLTVKGPLSLPAAPASAAGPDLKELVLGSEGRLGIITEVVTRVTELPETDDFFGVFLPDWQTAEEAVRELSVSALPFSMIRLSNPAETRINLMLAGHEKMMGGLARYLGLRGIGEQEGCMAVFGLIGKAKAIRSARAELKSHLGAKKGVWIGRVFGNAWKKNRFKAPYLRNTLWDQGYAVDTVETAVNWNRVAPTMRAMEEAVTSAMESLKERVMVFSHLSHVYPTGSSIYTTFLFRVGKSPEETLALWREAKKRVSRAIVEHGGTISHQHGVGTDHAPFLEPEKGALGLEMISTLCRQVDPGGIMNPGKLLPLDKDR